MTASHRIMGVNDEGYYAPVGLVMISDDGQVSFSEETPPEVVEEINDGLPLPAPFMGKGLRQWVSWLLSRPTITVGPCDPQFEEALERYNETQFLWSQNRSVLPQSQNTS